MSQNRDAPAYQEYAATILAQIPFRAITLQQRGLLYTMRLECWVNEQLPNDHNILAKVLGQPVAEIAESLAAVMPFFRVEGEYIRCPQLDDYRAHLDERKNQQSRGGKRGSAVTNSKRQRPGKAVDKGGSSTSASTPSSNSRVPRRDSVESLVQQSTSQPSQNQPVRGGVDSDGFVQEYEATEAAQCTANEYRQASDG